MGQLCAWIFAILSIISMSTKSGFALAEVDENRCQKRIWSTHLGLISWSVDSIQEGKYLTNLCIRISTLTNFRSMISQKKTYTLLVSGLSRHPSSCSTSASVPRNDSVKSPTLSWLSLRHTVSQVSLSSHWAVNQSLLCGTWANRLERNAWTNSLLFTQMPHLTCFLMWSF